MKTIFPEISKEHWIEKLYAPEILEIRLKSWKSFYPLVCDDLLDETSFIWRGQSCDTWRLEPSLDRALRDYSVENHAENRKNHLNRFQLALRGRRGNNPVAIPQKEENEWWALGQHQGLVTPLLDWTKSPFVSLFFAFSKNEPDQTENRVVYALNRNKVKKASSKAKSDKKIHFISPFVGDNPRLINQTGLFTSSTFAPAHSVQHIEITLTF